MVTELNQIKTDAKNSSKKFSSLIKGDKTHEVLDQETEKLKKKIMISKIYLNLTLGNFLKKN